MSLIYDRVVIVGGPSLTYLLDEGYCLIFSLVDNRKLVRLSYIYYVVFFVNQ